MFTRSTLSARPSVVVLPIVLTVVAILLGSVPHTAIAQANAPSRPAVTGLKTFSIDLSGESEVPGPGAEGSGTAFLVVSPNARRICYALSLSGIRPPGAAHIHEGAAGTAGGPVVDFDLANRGYGGCVTDVDGDLVRRIASNPSNFYVNVHNDDFPAGALRGQLE